jgi:hypothetical protein
MNFIIKFLLGIISHKEFTINRNRNIIYFKKLLLRILIKSRIFFKNLFFLV